MLSVRTGPKDVGGEIQIIKDCFGKKCIYFLIIIECRCTKSFRNVCMHVTNYHHIPLLYINYQLDALTIIYS